MNLKKCDKRIKVTRPESAKASEVIAPLLSAMQVAKVVRKKQDCFLIRVMPKDADVAQPAAAPAVLEDKPDSFLESRMEEIKQRFSTVLVDKLPAGLIAPEDVPKNAFSTPFGHYQFKVLASPHKPDQKICSFCVDC